MPRLKISDAPLLGSIVGDEKIPTGKYGDYTLTPDMIVSFAQGKLPFVTQVELAQVKIQLENSINTVQTTLTAEIGTLSGKVDGMESQVLGVTQDLTIHKTDYNNPHQVSKAQVGLGNVDNTSDENKPISTATQAALNQKISSVNGKTGNSITLTRDDVGVPTDDQIKAFTKETKYVVDESGLTQQAWNNGVDQQSDLLLLTNAKSGNRVFVKSIQQWFTYTPLTSELENGVTIVGKWVMDIPPEYLASWFAQPTIKEDQREKLRIGYAYATSKRKPFVIDDVYWVAVTNTDRIGLNILSSSILDFGENGWIKLIENNFNTYNILRFYDCHNFKVINARLTGDWKLHTFQPPSTGEWGHGICLAYCTNGEVINPHTEYMTGDGIDIGRLESVPIYKDPENVVILDATVRNTRRNGISPRSSVNCKIIRPNVRYVGDYDGLVGTAPKAGIDVEPNNAVGGGDKPSHINLVIDSPTISDCYAGIYFPNHFANKVEISITGISRFHNCTNTVFGIWNRHTDSSGYVDVNRAIVSGTVYSGIQYATVADSNFRVTFHEIVIDDTIRSFPVRHLYNGFSGTEGVIGNATFVFNTTEKTNVNILINESDQPYTLDSRFLTAKTSYKNVLIYTELTSAAQFPKYGKNFEIDGFSSYSSTAATFSRRSAKVLRLKTDTDTQIKALTTTNDYSVKTVIYDPTSANTTYGIRVNNLTLNIGGAAKTSALTKDIGATITYRNVEGGQTELINMTGIWTFA